MRIAGIPGGQPLTRRSGGFTPLVVIIVLLGAAAVVLAVAFLLPHRGAEVKARAAALASETAEDLLAARDDDADLAPGAHADPANPRDGVYDVRWTVEGAAHARHITVTVARRNQKAPDAQVVVQRPD